jgi:hypothetical protein
MDHNNESDKVAEAGPEPKPKRRSPLDSLFDAPALSPGDEVAQLAAGSAPNLKELDVSQLYQLRQEVDGLLPPHKLTEVDLVEELLLQYQVAKTMLASVLTNPGVPANQKAQVQNSCVGVLKQVTETQTRLYDAETIKCMEQALEKAFALVPQAAKEAFYERYSELLRASAGRKS